jgi:glutamine synthetase
MQIRAAFEGEFSLLVQDDDTFKPIDTSLCFSTVGMNTAAPVITAIVDALEAQGLQVEQYYAELAHGQQELSIRHSAGLEAADKHITYRETVRGVAQQHGFLASFAPKPFVDQAGNGCHLHFSLVGKDSRTSLFHDPAAPYQLSVVARQFIAGVLEHLPALVALTCASVNSYRRLQPQAWSSAFTCWGPDNREAAIRVVSPFAGDEEGTVNAELKACDHSSNPYIALGALIAAGLDGVSRELQLPDPILVDPSTLSDAERAERGVRRLPGSLPEALDALALDTVLPAALGTELHAAVQGVKRLEARLFGEQDVSFELAQHNTRF